MEEKRESEMDDESNGRMDIKYCQRGWRKL